MENHLNKFQNFLNFIKNQICSEIQDQIKVFTIKFDIMNLIIIMEICSCEIYNVKWYFYKHCCFFHIPEMDISILSSKNNNTFLFI